jgi:hypothetical protein
MTHDEIIEMARQHFCRIEYDNGNVHEGYEFSLEELEDFAKLVAAKEREACAKVANQISDKYGYGYYGNEVDTADEIAKAIRTKGES